MSAPDRLEDRIIDFRDPSTESVRVDALGAVAFIAKPDDEPGVLLDLEGMTNRPPSKPGEAFPVRARRHRRFLLSLGVAVELRDELDAAIREHRESGS